MIVMMYVSFKLECIRPASFLLSCGLIHVKAWDARSVEESTGIMGVPRRLTLDAG